MRDYDTVIGIEVHVELNTKSKIYCACSVKFGQEPNTQVCPVCLGLPGALPVLNREAVEKSVAAGLVLNCDINEISYMDRKNYFYPDSPKAYQISQLYKPFCENGHLTFDYVDKNGENQTSTVRIERIHLEEDAGKSMHEESAEYTLLDFNRCGVPLIEIVTYPDMTCGEEAAAFVDNIRKMLSFADISDCKMQEGSMRADVNLSLKPKGAKELGTRTEMKNLNSLKSVQRAAKSEQRRQRDILDDGDKVVQETRGWNDAKGNSYSMRSKEEAHDYRYFPDPDLLPVRVSDVWKEEIRAALPEMPSVKMERYLNDYSLPEYDSSILTSQPQISAFFEGVIQHTKNYKSASNFIMGDILRILKEKVMDFSNIPFEPKDLAELIKNVDEGVINVSTARNKVLEEMFKTGKNPNVIIQKQGLKQMGDTDEVLAIVKKVIADNPGPAQQLKDGNEKVIGFLMGQVMKATKGKAKPDVARELIIKEIGDSN